jgi:hypothetical protein
VAEAGCARTKQPAVIADMVRTQFDAFAAVMALVQLAVDPKAVEARLAELKTALAKLERATKELSRREIHFNADMARRQAELAEAAEVARRRQLAAIEAESRG